MSQTANPSEAYADQPFHMGDRIRKARGSVGQDRQTFAETIGIHRDTLAKYEETGKAKRSALISIAWATGVRVEWLQTGELPWRAKESPRPEGPGGGTDDPSTGGTPLYHLPRVVHVDFAGSKEKAA